MPTLLDRKLEQDVMLRQIEDVLRHGRRQDPPAYTLILGAGASFGVVPTAKQMLGIADRGVVHEECIPAFLHERQHGVKPERGELRHVVRAFWDRFLDANPEFRGERTERNKHIPLISSDADGVPDGASIAHAYKSIFDQRRTSGLNTPSGAREYLRSITLGGRTENIALNGTHFFLASLLSLQTRTNEMVDGQPVYVGQRSFARTLFTTNFDPLLQVSLQLFHLLYYMTDRPESLAADGLHTDEHPAIHLFYAHGSVHRPFLANTEEEIRHLHNNARSLAAYFGQHGVIVLGYSGWDDCLLRALHEINSFGNNLYWLARGADSISPKVEAFLCSRPNTFWVPITDGGEFMAALHRRLCPGMAASELLRNPIPFVERRLRHVNLQGIDAPRRAAVNFDAGETAGAMENPPSPEELRQQVVGLLEESARHFVDLSAVESAKIQLNRIVHQADLANAEKKWKTAVELYSKVVEHPQAPVSLRARACIRRGDSYLQQEEYAAALADYGRVVDLPGAPVEQVAQAHFQRGMLHNAQGKPVEASVDFTCVIDTPGSPSETLNAAFYLRALSYTQQGKWSEALLDYERVVDRPNLPSNVATVALYFRGVSHMGLGMIAEALTDFTRIIDDPCVMGWALASGLLRRGKLFERRGKLQKAIADYSRVIDLPDVHVDTVVEALIRRGGCHEKQGKEAEQLTDYSRAVDWPGASVALMAKGLLRRASSYHQLGKVTEEIADYGRVIDLQGAPAAQVSEALVARGFCYGEQGKVAEKVADYTHAIGLPCARIEDVALSLINRGIHFENLGNTAAAIADYDRVIALAGAPTEQVADALVCRGDCHREEGRIAEARADYRRAIDLPDAPDDLVAEARRKLKFRQKRAKATHA